MTDLINGRTPEEIKAGLRACTTGKTPGYGCNAHCPYLNVPNCWLPVKVDALALIEHLEAQQPKWISAEERLPEMYEDGSADIVLVTDGQFIHMAAYSNEKWYFAECGEMKEPMFYKVTHWMPLPEPPEEASP